MNIISDSCMLDYFASGQNIFKGSAKEDLTEFQFEVFSFQQLIHVITFSMHGCHQVDVRSHLAILFRLLR